jgi:SAM-dependent methyltransferase
VPEAADLTRLRVEYAARERRLSGSDLYSLFNPTQLFIIQQRQRAILQMLRSHGFEALASRRILELGCGGGGVLLDLLNWGALTKNLHGTDLLLDRLRAAQTRLPLLVLACAEGQALPYRTAAFDMILQFTVFSSILDAPIKANLAREMVRVLCPGGLILWYDFWLNPTNPQTRGIRLDEIRRLFPNCRYDFRRLTLAPPLARAIVPISWTLALILEKFTVFNSHYLVAIRPSPS